MITDYVALFGAGVASFLAPCLVPLVPAYLGMIVGESGDSGDTAAAVPATLIFIAGFAAVFAGLGVAAGLIGSSLSSVQDALQRIGGVIVIVLGLVLLGAVRGRIVQERRLITRLPNVGGSAGRSSSGLRSVQLGVRVSGLCSARRSSLLLMAANRCAAACCCSPTPPASVSRSFSRRSASPRHRDSRRECDGSARRSSESAARSSSCSACCWRLGRTRTSRRTWRSSLRRSAACDELRVDCGAIAPHRTNIRSAGRDLTR